MKQLRLHKEVYAASAVDEAVEVYAPHADIARSEQEGLWLLQINSPDPQLERRIAGELGNYVLGLTIRAQADG